ncbi:hypothetical protein JY97_10830 [Alkalispirochaeta odontotermitis]|nr:hypothetical protein JY97_10830 [Alkalispirochaeta odontotermitis]CAB1073042.1 hypothetical protein D1AOALGA4SA_1749 [Olavius algarvensis Delta 1 endosymbiont]
MDSYFYFFTTDFSQSYTEILSRLQRNTKNCFKYTYFSVTLRALPWYVFYLVLEPLGLPHISEP